MAGPLIQYSAKLGETILTLNPTAALLTALAAVFGVLQNIGANSAAALLPIAALFAAPAAVIQVAEHITSILLAAKE
ncbi:hypothetical protein MIMGU_mgv1a017414mg [Erythranthe guttata]|uniref:Uncharacterized protein n=1 Tax=Erythranthe guttata TaxID=4155 RepID=A0A022RY43_ERYGU|nr:hypothetical protein MIMGU_mgv1a017414mg [Erythranthe guttata]